MLFFIMMLWSYCSAEIAVQVETPGRVEVCSPFNVTCLVRVDDIAEVNYVVMTRFYGNNVTQLMKNADLSNMLKTDRYGRFDATGYEEDLSNGDLLFRLQLTASAALLTDTGVYTCELILNSDDEDTPNPKHSKQLSIAGSSKNNHDCKQFLEPPTTPATTTDVLTSPLAIAMLTSSDMEETTIKMTMETTIYVGRTELQQKAIRMTNNRGRRLWKPNLGEMGRMQSDEAQVSAQSSDAIPLKEEAADRPVLGAQHTNGADGVRSSWRLLLTPVWIMVLYR